MREKLLGCEHTLRDIRLQPKNESLAETRGQDFIATWANMGGFYKFNLEANISKRIECLRNVAITYNFG